jgi:hypothetical protein
MKFFERFRLAFQRSDDFKAQLFAFLGSDAQELRGLGGKIVTREQARELLQELIPAEIEMRGICRRPIAVVAAAPHVSFDNWSEYFCNRTARRLSLGWVVARNFRDQDPRTIPAPIGRHLHVNRPTESLRPGGDEFFSERAQEAHEKYLATLLQASGKKKFPIDLLIEFHSQMRTPKLEIATVGLDQNTAREIDEHYTELQAKLSLPELALEPLHPLRMTAETTKKIGSLRTEIARCSLHIEVPREFRRGDLERRRMCQGLVQITKLVVERLAGEAA